MQAIMIHCNGSLILSLPRKDAIEILRKACRLVPLDIAPAGREECATKLQQDKEINDLPLTGCKVGLRRR